MAEMNISDIVAGALEKIREDGYAVFRWIPCSVELPEDDKEVLICFGKMKRFVKIGFIEQYEGLKYWCIHGHSHMQLNAVCAWMELPDPPEIENKKGAEADETEV